MTKLPARKLALVNVVMSHFDTTCFVNGSNKFHRETIRMRVGVRPRQCELNINRITTIRPINLSHNSTQLSGNSWSSLELS